MPVAGDDAISRPTALNESQKPGCVNAHGSKSVTTKAAPRRTRAHGQRSPPACSSVTVASIQTVRCDGTPQPAKKAYAVAATRPPHRAALGAGSQRIALVLRRQATPIRTPASHANIVTCRPLIDIR